jgi:hypothetical protein
MPQINLPIPSFLSGVSQQPRAVRPIEAAEEAQNGYIQIARGIEKRPPSEVLGPLTNATGITQLLHTIDRDEQEQYIAWVGEDEIRVYDTQGTEYPVAGPASQNYLPDYNYLKTPADNPLSDLSLGAANDVAYLVPDDETPAGPWDVKAGSFTATRSDRTTLEDGSTLMSGPHGERETSLIEMDTSGAGAGVDEWEVEIVGAKVSFVEDNWYRFSIFVRGWDEVGYADFDRITVGFRVLASSYVGVRYLPSKSVGPDWTYSVGALLADSSNTITPEITEFPDGWTRLSIVVQATALNLAAWTEGEPVPFVRLESTSAKVNRTLVFGPRLEVGIDQGTPTNYYTTSDLKAVSIADYTFVTNRAIKPQMSNALTPALDEEAIFFARQAAASQANRIDLYVDGAQYFKSGISSASGNTLDIATAVANPATFSPSLPSDITVTRSGNVVLYEADPGTSIDKIEKQDSGGDEFISFFEHDVSGIVDLPEVCKDGYQVKVSGDDELGADDFYLVFESEQPAEKLYRGAWSETAAPQTKYAFEGATMPHQLVRKQDDPDGSATGTPRAVYFEWGTVEWEDRTVGDEETNPEPSFIGEPITDLFFYNDRLGMLSGDNVIMSQASKFFNFWRTTTQVVPDDEVIDIAATGTDVAALQTAVQYDQRLMVFDRDRQYQVIHEGPLTPQSVRVDSVLEYDCLTDARPVPSGNTLFMATPRGVFSGVREVVPLGDDDFLAQDITEALPRYISGEIIDMASSPTEELLFVLTDDRDKLYVHSFYWEGREKRLASWGQWTFGNDYSIQAISTIQDELFMVVRTGNQESNYQLHLERVALGDQDPDFTFRFYLDSRFSRSAGSGDFIYNAGTGYTEWTPPSPVYTDSTYTLVQSAPGLTKTIDTGGSLDYGEFARIIAKFSWTGSEWRSTVQGDFTAPEYVAGIEYEFLYQFTAPYLSSQYAGGQARMTEGDLRLRRFFLNHQLSLDLELEFTPSDSNVPVSVTYAATPEDLGNDTVSGIGERETELRLAGRSPRSKLVVTSGGFGPCSLQSAEWICDYTSRTRR